MSSYSSNNLNSVNNNNNNSSNSHLLGSSYVSLPEGLRVDVKPYSSPLPSVFLVVPQLIFCAAFATMLWVDLWQEKFRAKMVYQLIFFAFIFIYYALLWRLHRRCLSAGYLLFYKNGKLYVQLPSVLASISVFIMLIIYAIFGDSEEIGQSSTSQPTPSPGPFPSFTRTLCVRLVGTIEAAAIFIVTILYFRVIYKYKQEEKEGNFIKELSSMEGGDLDTYVTCDFETGKRLTAEEVMQRQTDVITFLKEQTRRLSSQILSIQDKSDKRAMTRSRAESMDVKNLLETREKELRVLRGERDDLRQQLSKLSSTNGVTPDQIADLDKLNKKKDVEISQLLSALEQANLTNQKLKTALEKVASSDHSSSVHKKKLIG